MFDLQILNPNDEIPGPVLSASRLDQYLTCPRVYQIRYRTRRGRRRRPPVKFLLGDILHKSIEEANLFAMAEGHYPEWEDMASDFTETWMKAIAPYRVNNKVQLLEVGRHLLYAYHKEVMPWVKPAAAEQQFLISVDGVPVRGTIDLITSKGDLLDYKSRYGRPRGHEADTSLQLSVYTLAYRALYGEWPRSARLLFFHRAPSCGLVLLPRPDRPGRRTAGQLTTAVNLLKHTHRMLEEKNFIPTPGNHCARCRYRRDCPAVS